MQSTLNGKVVPLRRSPAGPCATAPRHDIPADRHVALPRCLLDDAWWLCGSPPRDAAQVVPFRPRDAEDARGTTDRRHGGPAR